MGGQVKVGLSLPRELDREIEIIAAKADMRKNELAELGLRIVRLIYERGLPCPELSRELSLLDKRGHEILNRLLQARLEAEARG